MSVTFPVSVAAAPKFAVPPLVVFVPLRITPVEERVKVPVGVGPMVTPSSARFPAFA